jgi:hypothetical protein
MLYCFFGLRSYVRENKVRSNYKIRFLHAQLFLQHQIVHHRKI